MKKSLVAFLAALLCGVVLSVADSPAAPVQASPFAGPSDSAPSASPGTLWTWGRNGFGQLGDGSTNNGLSPVQVAGLDGVSDAGGGYYHTTVLKSDGTVWGWGQNAYGQLGDGTNTNRSGPTRVSGLSGVRAISVGTLHALALKCDGTVWAWGWGAYGQLGNGSTGGSNIPVQAQGLTDVVAVAAGGIQSLALKQDGSVWAWGYNLEGQLGDGTTTNRSTPVRVTGLTDVAAVSAAGVHSMALKHDGTVWAWGRNTYGQLGVGYQSGGDAYPTPYPVQVVNLSDVVAISGGAVHSLALKRDGTVWSWGLNEYGQLGDGSTRMRPAPVQVVNLTGVTSIAASKWGDPMGSPYHSLAVRDDGSVWAWGYNAYGQLGIGSADGGAHALPVQVSTPGAFTNVAAGGYHSLAFVPVPVGVCNHTPTACANGPYSVAEGSSITMAGSGSDPDGDALTYSWDLDNDGNFETPGQDVTFSAAGKDGPATPASLGVRLRACDTKGACSDSPTTVSITNAPPQVGNPSVSPEPSNEANSVTASATFTDPYPNDTPFTCTVNYGDGSGDLTGNVTGSTCMGPPHVYADNKPSNAPYEVKVSVKDKDGGTGTNSANHAVSNVAPIVTSITVPTIPIALGTASNVSGTFTDPAGALDSPYSATWYWDDGTSSNGTITPPSGSAPGSVTGSHTYSAAGVYTVKVVVTDKDGGKGELSATLFLVAYDPNGGFVTGGGWIDSSAGAYKADPTLAGKATFGFVSKYAKGATVPTGNTEFQFHVASFNFSSTSYDWLVVNHTATNAQYKGSGTVNGAKAPNGQEYKFMLWATDGSPDTFRIKIWYEMNGTENLVYDNGTDQPISGGSIVVHR